MKTEGTFDSMFMFNGVSPIESNDFASTERLQIINIYENRVDG